ncbi:MAG: hypothetical protein JWP77_1106 [Polaromonas sp.]|nr:hypothetical protein [Polaromonas sp.]
MSDSLRSSAPPGGPQGVRRRLADRAWWPWLRRAGTLAFFGLVAWLLVSQARTIEWGRVLTSLRDYPLTSSWGAAALAVASYALYSCFDLLGRHYTGHTLRAATVMQLTFVSYAFNLNLGSVVGGIAFRYRLYSRLGLAVGTITRVMTFSMLANWMGYLLLAGAVFSLQPPALPSGWKIDAFQLRLIGFGLLALALAYLGACAFSSRRAFSLRGHDIELPSLRLAGLQMGMGAGNWLLMSGIVFILLQQRIDFFSVASVLLLASIAGVITHIPGNLGVLEAVFVALLSHRLPQHELLAGLVAYRVVYFLVPLLAAAALYLAMESRAKQATRSAA